MRAKSSACSTCQMVLNRNYLSSTLILIGINIGTIHLLVDVSQGRFNVHFSS